MPEIANFDTPKFADGVITITLVPPQNVGGLSFVCAFGKRFGVSSSGILFSRQVTSGYGGGQSGITVTNSGQGVFQVTAPTPEEMSGRDPGNYAYEFYATDSGGRGPLSQGYWVAGSDLRR